MSLFIYFFIAMIPIDCRIIPYTYLFTLFGNNYNIDKFTTSKESMTMTVILMGTTSIN